MWYPLPFEIAGEKAMWNQVGPSKVWSLAPEAVRGPSLTCSDERHPIFPPLRALQNGLNLAVKVHPEFRQKLSLDLRKGEIQQYATMVIKGVKHLTQEKRLKELGLFSLEKRQHLSSVYKHLMGGNKTDRDRLFSVVSSARRGKNHKLEYRKFQTDVRKNFSYCMVKHWKRLPTEVVDSSSSEILKTLPGKCLSNLLGLLLWAGNWTGWSPGVPSNVNNFMLQVYTSLSDYTNS